MIEIEVKRLTELPELTRAYVASFATEAAKEHEARTGKPAATVYSWRPRQNRYVIFFVEVAA